MLRAKTSSLRTRGACHRDPRSYGADLYLLESVEAAVGIATDRLREEFGAAVFKAQARVIPWTASATATVAG